MTIDANGTYIITQTNPETPTTNTIKVNPGVTATITLKDVNIDVSNGLTCAFDMHGESLNPTKVELILEGTNTLKSGLASTPITSSTWHDAPTTGYAGIFTGKYGDLTIKGEGTLNVDGGERGAAIGGCNSVLAPEGTAAIDYTHGGTIRIESGTINAYAGRWGSGIGDGDYKGNVDVSESAKVIITGGSITITGIANNACCFGHGSEDNVAGGYVLISGGNFSLPEGVRIFRSETAIISEKATINGGNQKIYSNGILYTGNTATQKGDVTLGADFENIEGSTLIIPVGATLTIPSDVSLTNNGTIILRGDINGIVSNAGTIIRQTRLTAEMVEKSDNSFVYNGNPKEFTTVNVKKGTSGYYTQGTDYSVSYTTNINAGDNTAVLKITSILSEEEGALCGEVTIPFTIKKAEAPTIDVFTSIEDKVYDGQPIVISAPVVNGVKLSNVPATLYYKLTSAEDDTYTKTAPTEAGAYTVKAVCESPNHEEATAQTATFNITKATTNAWTTPLATTTFTYGTNSYPTATATFGEVEYTYYKLNDDGTTYTECDQPTDVGTWYITAKVTETGSYPGLTETDKVPFTITQATDNAWTTPLSDVETPWTYGEDGNYPTAEAKYGTVRYNYYTYDSESGQYTSLEDKPVNAGTWYVKAYVEETENFNGLPLTDPKKFTIVEKTLTASMITLSSEEYTYNGYKPTITVKYGETTLKENTDYTVTWPDNAAGVGTHTVTITGIGNFTGPIEKTYTINSRPYIPPTPDPDPVYYTVTIPTEVTGAIIHGGGTHEVEEYTYYTFRIELDPNGNGEYPTVTKGYWWDTLTPDGQGNYRVYVTGNTQITIGEVPTNSYLYYQVTLPTDSVTEAENQYWSGDYIEVIGATPLRAAEEASISYQAPFGATVTLRPIETERRKFLMWEDGSSRKERTLTLRADQEIKALWKRISPTGIEAIADGSVIRGERGQLYIEVPEPCDVTLYTYGGVPVRVARLAAGANRLANLNAGLYLVKIGAAPAVPVRVR